MSLSPIQVVRLAEPRQFAPLKEFFEADNPGLRLSLVQVDGDAVLHSDAGGMRVFWIFQGEGEVFLPKGYRTQEGDGQLLPSDYQAAPIAPAFVEKLRLLQERRASVAAAPYTALTAILRRWQGDGFVGDFAGELWKLDHLPRPWAADPEVEKILQSLFRDYRPHGFSVKQTASFERLIGGDQLIVSGEETLQVRGRFTCLSMENVRRRASHVSATRRLRFLADTAGGCNPDFDPFRRLPLTWQYNDDQETGDGLNWVNSHVVNIPKETSPSHFHPPKGIGGGVPQREMYLVLDPRTYALNTWGRSASLVLFPNLRDLSQHRQIPLEPGLFIYIPPGTGHRGLDAFVNVLTIPGFKPHNEYYLDRDISALPATPAPFNANLLGLKNYEQLAEFLI